VPSITTIRRANVVVLYQEFLQGRVAAGDPPKGLDQAFAATLEISPSMWSQIKSSRPIGDKLARQIERHAGTEAGWLDVQHEGQAVIDAGEERFVEAARLAWRRANAKEKRELMKLIATEKSPIVAPRS
jgi:IS5 family transposase